MPAGAAPTPADAQLLQKAVGTLEGRANVQVTSEVVVTGAGQDIMRTMREHVVFTRQGKSLLRATASVSGGENRMMEAYLTVGDGQHVWTVAPLDQEYAQAAEEAFRQPSGIGRHVGALGLLGAMLAGQSGLGGDVLQDFAATATATGQSLGTAKINGKAFREIALTMGGNRVWLYLDPRTATIGRLVFTGAYPQMHLTVTDTITRQATAPALAPQAFQFTPPHGFRQVSSVPIGFLP